MSLRKKVLELPSLGLLDHPVFKSKFTLSFNPIADLLRHVIIKGIPIKENTAKL